MLSNDVQVRVAPRATPRGLATRSKILSTAAALIAERGYNATGVQAICDASDVARGSILHQFPTRIDLMRGVAKFCADEVLTKIQALLQPQSKPVDRLLSFSDALKDACQSTHSLALTELQDAAHWDAALLSLIKPEAARMIGVLNADLEQTSARAGIAAPDALMPHMMLMIYALRGIAISGRMTDDCKALESYVNAMELNWRAAVHAALPAKIGAA